MKPKLLFVLKTALGALAIVLFFAFAVFVLSFIMFKVRATGIWYAPGFGFRGMQLFLTRFPWHLLVFVLIAVAILELLAKKFSWVYKRPLVYSIAGILLFVAVAGFAVSRTTAHPQLFRVVQEGKMPIMGPFYHGRVMQPPANLHIGEISAISGNGFFVKNEKGEILEVIVSPQTVLPKGEEMREGDLIMIMGERKDSFISAFGVRKIEKDRDSFFPQFNKRRGPNRLPANMMK